MKTLDVTTICNALVDILTTVEDSFLDRWQLRKALMHLTSPAKQQELLAALAGKDFKLELGGSSLNCIRALALMGRKTAFAGMIADDDFGSRIAGRLGDLNIASHLKVDSRSKDAATGSCLVLITPDGERTMNTCLGSSVFFDESIIPQDDIEDSKIFHFCGYQWDSPSQKAAIRRAMEIAKKAGTLISFDLADPFVVEKNREEFIGLVKDHADIVFANEQEAQLLLNLGDAQRHCSTLADWGCMAAVKVGAKGAYVAAAGETPTAIRPYPTQVHDTTAAGDLFAAGFLFGLTGNESVETSGRIGASLAADVITRLGADLSQEALRSALRRVNASSL